MSKLYSNLSEKDRLKMMRAYIKLKDSEKRETTKREIKKNFSPAKNLYVNKQEKEEMDVTMEGSTEARNLLTVQEKMSNTFRNYNTVEKRMALVREVERRKANGEKIADICKNIGINFTTFYVWRKNNGVRVDTKERAFKSAATRKLNNKRKKKAHSVPSYRSNYSESEKISIVDSIEKMRKRSKAEMSEICKLHGITDSCFYTWRRQLEKRTTKVGNAKERLDTVEYEVKPERVYGIESDDMERENRSLRELVAKYILRYGLID